MSNSTINVLLARASAVTQIELSSIVSNSIAAAAFSRNRKLTVRLTYEQRAQDAAKKILIARNDLLRSPNASEKVSPTTSTDVKQGSMICRAKSLSDTSRKKVVNMIESALNRAEQGKLRVEASEVNDSVRDT